MRLVLEEGEEKTVSAYGQFLFVRDADGPVRISITREDGRISDYRLRPREQLEFPGGGITEITVKNQHSGANVVRIETGWGKFIPFVDGEAVYISGQTATLDVQFEVSQPVTLTGSTGPLEVQWSDPLPVSVDLDGPMPVYVPVGSDLATQEVRAPLVNPGNSVQPGSLGVNIRASSTRRDLIVKAAADNAAPVWVSGAVGSGIPLYAGERERLASYSGSLPLIAENETDKVHVLEVER